MGNNIELEYLNEDEFVFRMWINSINQEARGYFDGKISCKFIFKALRTKVCPLWYL
jgi:hypothetical protein